MAVMKSEQIMSESKKSFEDAIQVAVTRFSKTVRGLRSANVNNMSTVIEDGKIALYRVNLQMTFEVGEPKAPAKKKKK
ncbi:MAG: dodecin family protein [Pseudomonadota bacterium]